MQGFLRIFCIFGIPMLAIAALFIWKPSDHDKGAETSLTNRIVWTIFALIASPLLCVPVVSLPTILLLVWKPGRRTLTAMADRLAWTIFALGVCLMLTMVLYTMAQEGDGSWRTLETIRLHSRLFLAISIIPIIGPLIVYLAQAARARRSSALAKKAPVDDWESEPPFGSNS